MIGILQQMQRQILSKNYFLIPSMTINSEPLEFQAKLREKDLMKLRPSEPNMGILMPDGLTKLNGGKLWKKISKDEILRLMQWPFDSLRSLRVNPQNTHRVTGLSAQASAKAEGTPVGQTPGTKKKQRLN